MIGDTLAGDIDTDPTALKVNTLSPSLYNSLPVQSRFEKKQHLPLLTIAIMIQIRRKLQRYKLMRYYLK
jgi:hypothetical protein